MWLFIGGQAIVPVAALALAFLAATIGMVWWLDIKRGRAAPLQEVPMRIVVAAQAHVPAGDLAVCVGLPGQVPVLLGHLQRGPLGLDDRRPVGLPVEEVGERPGELPGVGDE